MKPVISATRVSVFQLPTGRECDRLVVSTQLFATHYVTASLSMMTIIDGAGSGPGLFVYANRSRADGLDGWFGGIVRRKVEARIRAAAPAALIAIRDRLQSQPRRSECARDAVEPIAPLREPTIDQRLAPVTASKWP